jgi:hypothetical protein
MFRYSLRTLLILLAIGPPLVAGVWWLGPWAEWSKYSEARAAVAVRQSEMNLANKRNNGSRLTLAGVRHARLRLEREETRAAEQSWLYRQLSRIETQGR